MKTWLRYLAVGLPLLLALAACDPSLGTASLLTGQLVEEPPPPPPPEEGLTALSVEVAGVEAHATGGGWFELATASSTWDVLADHDLSEVGFGELPAGSYTQIRILVAAAEATINGVVVALDVPSERIKLVGEKFDVLPGGHLEIAVLFDAEHSIVEHGNGSFHLKPVVHYQIE